MLHEFSRMEPLVGEKGLERLYKTRVAVFGIGGVGSYVVEALARSGVGSLTLVDNDTVSITNINRQLIALRSTLGRSKTQVAKERVLDINSDAIVNTYETFVNADTIQIFDFSTFDYIVDAVDTVTTKLLLIEKAKERGVPIISCMGTGNKLDPSCFQITDISKTSVCPLAKVIRTELKKRKIRKVKVLFSTEQPIKDKKKLLSGRNTKEVSQETKGNTGRPVPGSVSFVPSVAGLMIAGEVIKDLLSQ
ncbi:MAG: tRNA threonylcarbamoyladenosine dehydratase [Lachnospiraceae bacterium]|jgi:tRNA A37 threonylcarbamoyladenosine dehydratase